MDPEIEKKIFLLISRQKVGEEKMAASDPKAAYEILMPVAEKYLEIVKLIKNPIYENALKLRLKALLEKVPVSLLRYYRLNFASIL